MSRLARLIAILLLSLGAASPAFGAPDEESMAHGSVQLLAKAKERIEALQENLAMAPGESRQALAATHKSLMSGAGVRGFTYVMILLLVGIGVEWLYWTYAYSSLRAIQATPASSPMQAMRLGSRHFALRASGLLLFTLATIGASAAFTWPQGVHELIVAATILLLILRLVWTVVHIIVAPGRPSLRLIPVPPAKARWLAGAALTTVALLSVGHIVPEVLNRVGGTHHAGGALRLIAYSAAALTLVAACIAIFGGQARGKGGGFLRAPVFPRTFVLVSMVVAVYAVWLMNASAAGIAAIAAVVIAVQIALPHVVFFFWRDAAAPGGPAKGTPSHDPGALPYIVLSAARFLVVLLGVGAGALALDAPLESLAASESPAMRIGLRLLGVATLALLTHVLWIGAKTVIDQRLARIRPTAPHGEPDANARLLTLLPLLRVTAAVVLVVMLALSSLWALGIEITPLLAGAGVIGLALGFGAQALVRDVIAGVFFLAEDAFRIGEYIESGTTTKGNVERISLRTVALRHHNGPLIFVPYGALGTVRNTSRDWVIEKFNLPLPIGTDSEMIRKMIKKVGEEMKADPEVGPLIMESLKGKLYRVDPGVKIFRCKFRTAPGKQFDVRAQALKRVEVALKAIGVSFADGTQTVLVPAPPAA